MILSDGTIRQLIQDDSIKIVPEPADEQYQPASVDVTLGDRFLRANPHTLHVDPHDLFPEMMEVAQGPPFYIHPGEFVLAHTVEQLALPSNIVARVEGRSSLGRLGLTIHSTAGFVDPGWPLASITLELYNQAQWSLSLHPGMRIGQLVFETLDRPARRPYGHPGLKSRYVGQVGPVASRFTADEA